MRKSQNILVSPLNWGLGHATRLIPIIEWCLKNNKNVFILGNGEAFKLLCERFPDCKNIYLSAPKMRYGKKTTIFLEMYSKIISQKFRKCYTV